MRHITQTTITDRIFGNRQDRQGVIVTGFVHVTAKLLRLLGKRAWCPAGHEHRAETARYSSWLMSMATASRWAMPGHDIALCCPALVEVSARERC